jgi:hypothetical protein
MICSSRWMSGLRFADAMRNVPHRVGDDDETHFYLKAKACTQRTKQLFCWRVCCYRVSFVRRIPRFDVRRFLFARLERCFGTAHGSCGPVPDLDAERIGIGP